MKFIFEDSRFQELDAGVKKEITEKLFAAEKNVALLRSLVILLSFYVYFIPYDRSQSIEWLCISILVVAGLYSLFVLLFQPYRKYPLLLTSYYTSGTDAFLIALWMIGTNGIESPYYMVWYISILAVAMRYTMAVTIKIATIYAAIYLAIILYMNGYAGNETEIVLRLSYIFLIAAAGGFMSKEVLEQIEAKILIKRSKEEIRLREAQLKEAHNKLEERVRERTKELNESNKQLKRINEDIDNFVYSASHDLKSPILNMEALLTMLIDSHPPSSDLEKNIHEKLDVSVTRMKNTINRLAEVAKAQKEVYDDLCEIKFKEILEEVISENEEVIRKEGAQIIQDFANAPQICFSKTCIKSIIYNLLTNAIKYRSDKSPEVEFFSLSKDGFVELHVKDNGLGIDLERNRNKLFTIFKRFHDHVEGAGIGLYTVKRMIEKFGGEIDVESEPGKGSLFKLRFKPQPQLADILDINSSN